MTLPPFLEGIRGQLPGIALTILIVAVALLVHMLLNKRWKSVATARLRLQLSLFAIWILSLLLALITIPMDPTLRGQLLTLLGILLSAAIALSSTTLLGNAMARGLLQIFDNVGIGDFLRVGDHFGRISEIGLFHTEIQTENRNLTTLPNLYLVANPHTVFPASGTIVSATLSLGYDVGHRSVRQALMAAAVEVNLEKPFVSVVDIGDFSITYRVAGLLADLKQLVSTRSKLRIAALDALHGAGIEILSPNFHSLRSYPETKEFIPRQTAAELSTPTSAPEDLMFDKADRASLLAELQLSHGQLVEQMDRVEEELKSADQDRVEALEKEKLRVEERRARLEAFIARTEERLEDA